MPKVEDCSGHVTDRHQLLRGGLRCDVPITLHALRKTVCSLSDNNTTGSCCGMSEQPVGAAVTARPSACLAWHQLHGRGAWCRHPAGRAAHSPQWSSWWWQSRCRRPTGPGGWHPAGWSSALQRGKEAGAGSVQRTTGAVPAQRQQGACAGMGCRQEEVAICQAVRGNVGACAALRCTQRGLTCGTGPAVLQPLQLGNEPPLCVCVCVWVWVGVGVCGEGNRASACGGDSR